MNGLNGGGLSGGAMVGLPTPAGHQAELNYIHAMVEELSRQLAENKRQLEDVVTGVGRVRNRARAQQLGNEELITDAGDNFSEQEANLEAYTSALLEALEKAQHARDENAALVGQFATVMSTMLKQVHDYKQKHVRDVAAWHRSYRSQLAEARAENSRLREQIWEMQHHAGVANESLRKFRAAYDVDRERWERRVDHQAVRQELRFWKRMAMPELPDDDPYWSDDDDLMDAFEKVRLHELEKKVAQEAAAAAAENDSSDQGDPEGPPTGLTQLHQPMPMLLGGVAMQREGSVDSGMPMPPPRPSSASSTGSSGQ